MIRNQSIILLAGGAAALLIALFPDWIAVHPQDPGLTISLGHFWAFAPPPPPPGFEAMVVEKGSFWLLSLGILSFFTAAVYWLSRR
jgi:hypothetical protein